MELQTEHEAGTNGRAHRGNVKGVWKAMASTQQLETNNGRHQLMVP